MKLILSAVLLLGVFAKNVSVEAHDGFLNTSNRNFSDCSRAHVSQHVCHFTLPLHVFFLDDKNNVREQNAFSIGRKNARLYSNFSHDWNHGITFNSSAQDISSAGLHNNRLKTTVLTKKEKLQFGP